VKKLIVFDLDGTLAESKSSLDAEMSTLLSALLGVVKVAVISGGDWPQFLKQLLTKLPDDERLNNLSLLPATGTKFYAYSSGWKKLCSEKFPRENGAWPISLRPGPNRRFRGRKPAQDAGFRVT